MTEVETGIPSSIEEVTPGWLSAVLGHTVTGARAERIAQDSEKVTAQLDEISNAAGQALEEVRGIAYNLRNIDLALPISLTAAIKLRNI